jgi:hypothetical protein
MTAGAGISPNYRPGPVERAVLETVIDLLPARLTVDDLCLRIAANPEDYGEVEVIRVRSATWSARDCAEWNAAQSERNCSQSARIRVYRRDFGN